MREYTTFVTDPVFSLSVVLVLTHGNALVCIIMKITYVVYVPFL